MVGAGRWGRNQKKSSKGKRPPKKFIQSETQRKKNHGKDGPAISLKPEWFPVCQRLFLRGRFPVSVMSSFIVPRAKRFFFSRFCRSYLRPLADTEDSRHTQEKYLWYPGYQNDNIFWWEGENLCLNKRREDKIRNWLVTLLKTKYITICDFIAYKHRWVFSSDIFEEDMKNSATFFE